MAKPVAKKKMTARHTLTQGEARGVFWRAIEEHSPHVIEDLESNVIPLWKESAQIRNDNPQYWTELRFVYGWTGVRTPAEAAVRDWTERHGLHAEWCFLQAIRTMEDWLAGRSVAGKDLLRADETPREDGYMSTVRS